MRADYIIFIGALLLLMWVCEKRILTLESFFTPVEKSSNGITILEAKSNLCFINFTGKINLTEDTIEIIILKTDDDVVYAFRIHSNNPVSNLIQFYFHERA